MFAVSLSDSPSAAVKSKKYDTAGGSNIIYEGWARPKALASTAEWCIKKYTYDGSGNLTDEQWASGNSNYDKIWNSRATYTYA